MEIHFSDHAILKLGQRKILLSLVRQTVLSPDIRKPGNYPREEWYQRFGTRYLKVVLVREPKQVIVVTAHWVKKSPYDILINMKITYDKEVDALNVSIRPGMAAKTMEVAPEVLLDIDKKVVSLILRSSARDKRLGFETSIP